MKLKKLSITCLILCLLLSMIPATAAAAEEQVDSIKIGITKTQGPFTPFSSCSSKDWELIGLVYDSLYQLDATRTPIPCLATSYEISEDYTVYTFHLRDDVTWHDGTPFTSADVKFSYELPRDTVNSVNFTNPTRRLADIRTPDDYTVEFVFSAPENEAIVEDLFAFMPIVAEHTYQGLTADDIATADTRIGTGPYKLMDFDEESYYNLEANDSYWGGTPAAKKLTIAIISDKTAAYTALQSGQIDALTTTITSELVEQFKSSANLKVLEGPGFSSTLLFLNESRAPFDQKEFRQAVSCAIDVQDLVDTVLLGRGTAGSPGYVSPNSILYNPDTPAHEYNPDKAISLLDQLGYADVNGDGYREYPNGDALSLDLLVYASSPLQIRDAEMISEFLGKVGVNATVKAMESGTVDSLVAPNWDGVEDGDYDMAMWGWGDKFSTTPSRYVEQFHSDPQYGPSNLTRIKDAEMDEIMERITTSMSLEDRNKAVDDMQIFLADHVTMVPLYYADNAYGYNPNAYDGWILTTGKGYVNKLSLVNWSNGEADNQDAPQAEDTQQDTTQPSDTTNQPAATETKGNFNGLIILACAAILVIVIGVVVFRKKKK